MEIFCSFLRLHTKCQHLHFSHDVLIACMSVMQMREVLSKRKSSGHESYEDVGNQQDGLSGSSLQDW